MKFKSKVLALVLVASLPGSAFAMQANQEPVPNIMGMFKNVIDVMKRNEAVSWFAGGIAALVAYKFLTHSSGKKPMRTKNARAQNPAANPGIRQGVAYLVQHAQEAGKLFQEGKMPKAYLHGKYAEIAKQVGFDLLPQPQRDALKKAVIGFDVAFTGYDYATKKMVGVQAALRAAAVRLQNVLEQLVGHDDDQEPHVRDPRARSANPASSIFQAFVDQVKANPLQTIGLILSSGYGLLAQFYGWPPYVPAAPKQAPAQASAPEPGV